MKGRESGPGGFGPGERHPPTPPLASLSARVRYFDIGPGQGQASLNSRFGRIF